MSATQVTFPQVEIPDFEGDSGSGGSAGLVPAPGVGDAEKFLKGDGTFDTPILGVSSLNDGAKIILVGDPGDEQPGLSVDGAAGGDIKVNAAQIFIGNVVGSISCQFDDAAGTIGLNAPNGVAINGRIEAKLTQKIQYDFAVDDGGGVGFVNLEAIPDDFIITGAFIDIISALTGGGGCTIALTTGEAANDLVAAAAVTGAPWSTTGIKPTLIDLSDPATYIKTTNFRTIALIVTGAAITAGKFNLFIEGYIST